MTVAKKRAPSRTYRSALREEQARRTRTAVLDAAAEAFVEVGYAATTMKDVARRAGVSVETVYGQGSKASLLLAAVDRAIVGDEEPVALRDRPEIREMHGAATPAAAVAAMRDLVAGALRDSLPVMMAFDRAAGADPEIAAVHADYEARRRSDMVLLAAALRPGLRPEVTPDEAADVLTALFSNSFMHQFVGLHGWEPERFADWVAAAITRLLLREEAAGAP